MTALMHDVPDDLRASALDERDKGDKFESLVQAYLKTVISAVVHRQRPGRTAGSVCA